MPSPICLVKNGGGGYGASHPAVSVTPAFTITIKLSSTSGVSSWEIECISTDELISPASLPLTINTSLFEATFTAPAAGSAMLFRSRVNQGLNPNREEDSTYISYFKIYTLSSVGTQVMAVGETTEADSSYGWTGVINSVLRAGAGASVGSSTPSNMVPDQAGAAGASIQAARADHVHAIPCDTTASVGTTASEGVSTSFSRADHVHTLPFATLNTIIGTASASISVNSQKITNLGTPTASADAATKLYVDGATSGIQWKGQVRAVATSNITLSGAQTIDGVSVVATDRVAVTAQTSAIDNGIYVAAAGAWARSSDMAAASTASGAAFFVDQGTVYADTEWVCTTNSGSDVVGTNTLAFSRRPHAQLSTNTPVVPSSAGAPGSGTQASKDDHSHPFSMPTTFDIDYVNGTTVAQTTTSQRIAARSIDMSHYPTISGWTRAVTFKGVIESSADNISSEIQLYDITDNVLVTGSTFTNSGDESQPQEFSQTLTAGSSSGNIRTDSSHLYEVQLRRTNGVSTDSAICTNARVVVRYT